MTALQVTMYDWGGARRPLYDELVLPGRYYVLDTIGLGNYSNVYRAIDSERRCLVALKYTDLERFPAQLRPRVRSLFENEVRMLGEMEHPCIPQQYEHRLEGEQLFLVTEYVAAEPLDIYLHCLKRLSLWETLRIGLSLGEVLEYLHSRPRPVIHGDVNPANILWRPTAAPGGQVTLTDFGIARHISSRLTAAAQLRLARDVRLGRHSHSSLTRGVQVSMGTRGYAPREQYGLDRVTRRTDVFAFGATLYHLLTGRHPGECPDGLHACFDLSLLHRPGIPRDLVALLERTLLDKPYLRPKMGEALRELRRIAHETAGEEARQLQEAVS